VVVGVVVVGVVVVGVVVVGVVVVVVVVAGVLVVVVVVVVVATVEVVEVSARATTDGPRPMGIAASPAITRSALRRRKARRSFEPRSSDLLMTERLRNRRQPCVNRCLGRDARATSSTFVRRR
jgi:hypothetical protein